MYLLDANIFIEAKNRYYGFDFCPAFWDWILRAHKQGKVFSVDKVKWEIDAIDDELKQWASQIDSNFFLPATEAFIEHLGKVEDWITREGFEPSARQVFMEKADPYLIGYALSQNATIVTHEISTDSKKKIKIPSMCADLGIKSINTFELLRKERARFVISG